MNKPKKQGTEFETWCVNWFVKRGFKATRLAEGGSKDEGDIELINKFGTRFVIEARHRANLNTHEALPRAEGKSSAPVILAWKRLGRKKGNTRRTAKGPPNITLSFETFAKLFEGY